ncbi:hypothetical protein CGC20_27575 [Leishmania donovani]|uniref:Uncharacterized protein n=1 Tax=Leishmania donovani TaxID=5661 RepID=A0A504X182_LEIDO|nr:hypothetical protein CGC20_27575 [Leishmania donovani]
MSIFDQVQGNRIYAHPATAPPPLPHRRGIQALWDAPAQPLSSNQATRLTSSPRPAPLGPSAGGVLPDPRQTQTRVACTPSPKARRRQGSPARGRKPWCPSCRPTGEASATRAPGELTDNVGQPLRPGPSETLRTAACGPSFAPRCLAPRTPVPPCGDTPHGRLEDSLR